MSYSRLFQRPDWKRRDELARELAKQKKLLLDSSSRAAAAIRRDLSPESILRRYPYQSALLVMLGGLFLARKAAREAQARGIIQEARRGARQA